MATPAASSPNSAVTPVPATTTASAPGKLFFQRRSAISSATDPRPIAMVGRLTSPKLPKNATHTSWMSFELGRSSPNSDLSWLVPMMSAAADVKPLSTGWDRKFTRNPIRNRPMASCTTPTPSDARMASSMNRSEPVSARAPTPV